MEKEEAARCQKELEIIKKQEERVNSLKEHRKVIKVCLVHLRETQIPAQGEHLLFLILTSIIVVSMMLLIERGSRECGGSAKSYLYDIDPIFSSFIIIIHHISVVHLIPNHL